MFQCGHHHHHHHHVNRKLYFVFFLLFFSGFRFEYVSCTEKQVDTEVVQSGVAINDPAEVPHELEAPPSSSEDRKDISVEHNEQPVILSDEKTKLTKRLRDEVQDVTPDLFDSNYTVDISSTTVNLDDDRRSSKGPRRKLTTTTTTTTTTELDNVEYAAESEVSNWNPTKFSAAKSTSQISTSSEVTNVEGHFDGRRHQQSSISPTTQPATSTEESSVDFEEPSEVLYTVTEKSLEVISTVDESLTRSETPTESSSLSLDESSSSSVDESPSSSVAESPSSSVAESPSSSVAESPSSSVAESPSSSVAESPSSSVAESLSSSVAESPSSSVVESPSSSVAESPSSSVDESSSSSVDESPSSSVNDISADDADTEKLKSPPNNTAFLEVSTENPLVGNTSLLIEHEKDKSGGRSLQEHEPVTNSTRGFNGSAIGLLSSSTLQNISTNTLQTNTGVQFLASSTVSFNESTSNDDGDHLISSFEISSKLFTVEQLITSAIELQSVAVSSQISYTPSSLSSSYSSVFDFDVDQTSSMQPRMSSSFAVLFTSNGSTTVPSVTTDQQYGNEVQHESSITTTKHSMEEDSAVIFGQIEVEPTKTDDKQEESLPEEVENNDGGTGVAAADEQNFPVDEDEVPSKESKPREDPKLEDGSPKEESVPKIVAGPANETVKELLGGVSVVLSSTAATVYNRTSVTLYSSKFFDSTASGIPVLMSSMGLSSSSSVYMEKMASPAFDVSTSSYVNTSSELQQQVDILNSTSSERSTGFVPIVATKATSLMDRRTKYNRLPTERNTDDKDDHDVVTDLSYNNPDIVLPTIRVPVAYLSITLKCSWTYFCTKRLEFQKEFARQLKSAVKMNIDQSQVVFFNVQICQHAVFPRNVSVPIETLNVATAVITVPLYVSDEWGVYSKSLTELLGILIIRNRHRGTGSVNGTNVTVPNVVLAVQLHRKEESTSSYAQNNTNLDGDVGIIAVITISCIAAICLVLLFILLYVLKRRNGLKEKTRRCRPVGDAYSLDSVSSIHSSFRRRKSRASKRSYLNQGFDDPHATTNKLNFPGLANASIDDEALAEEYKQISMQMARYEELPVGAEVKNRYANIIPFPETRVVLISKTDESGSDYINANYVRGYRGEQKRYIACQAPLANTIIDFWQMVWENQCKVIVMLTAIEEDGVNKCAPYFSETDTLDCHRLYGDYQVTTKKKDVRESYTVSALQLKNLEKNLMRDVIHFWYTSWPPQNVPIDRNSITELLVETRPYTKSNSGPMVVHCSPGTGRTGTVIAIDICMHEFEFTRTVDIPRCVHRIRQDRGGSVQTSEQYIFIYEVLGEYASKLMNHSGRSSVRSTR